MQVFLCSIILSCSVFTSIRFLLLLICLVYMCVYVCVDVYMSHFCYRHLLFRHRQCWGKAGNFEAATHMHILLSTNTVGGRQEGDQLWNKQMHVGTNNILVNKWRTRRLVLTFKPDGTETGSRRLSNCYHSDHLVYCWWLGDIHQCQQ